MFKYLGKEAAIRYFITLTWLFGKEYINDWYMADVEMGAKSAGIYAAMTFAVVIGVGLFLLAEYLLLILLCAFVRSNTAFNVLRIFCANLVYLYLVFTTHDFAKAELGADLLSIGSTIALYLLPLLTAQWLLKDRMLAVLRRGLGFE